jgi:alpha,alpha-trehalose phosphorylase
MVVGWRGHEDNATGWAQRGSLTGQLRVEVGPDRVTYITDADGPPLQISHHGTLVSVAPGQPETRDIPALPAQPRPTQPSGRAPVHRGSGGASSPRGD